ncbi:MAG: 30S ribosomal protein S20 [Candidatus Krumholzibacteria bacterium]|nr:30S ribosomal protein S20 [Candidatus Krumholzibacteria bacterium]
MPQLKSAKRRVKIGLRNETRNRAQRSALRTSLKRVAQEKTAEPEAAVRKQQSILDRAVKAGLIHRNKAARLKSRFR